MRPLMAKLGLGGSPSHRAVLSGSILAAAPLLLYVYMPRPHLPGAHLLVYPVLAGLLFAIGSFLAVRRSNADRRLLIVAAQCLLLSVTSGVSSFVNANYLRATAPLDLLRPAVLLIFFAYGYYVMRYCGEREAERGLLTAAVVILAGQMVVAGLQAVGISFVDVLYTERKMDPLGSLVRVTGTLANPNFFGWIVAQASIMVLLLSTRPSRYFAVALGAPLVLLSGSRTLLILYPLMVGVGLLLDTPGRLKISRPALAYSFVIGLAFVVAIFRFGHYFPYLAQLAAAAESGSLERIGSLSVRLGRWEQNYAAFHSEGLSAWFVGLGSRETTRVLDSDFFYVIFRFGLLGFAIHLTLMLYLFGLLWSTRTSTVSKIGLQYFCFAVIMGAAFETLGGWMHPLLLFYFAGMAAGVSRRKAASRIGLAFGRSGGFRMRRLTTRTTRPQTMSAVG